MDKCSICRCSNKECIMASCNHSICAGCIHKEIFFNYITFISAEKLSDELKIICIICNKGTFKSTKKKIFELLDSLKNIKEDKPQCGTCNAGSNNQVKLFCIDCKLFSCNECEDSNHADHTFTKNLKKLVYNNKCLIHSEENLKLDCKTCSIPICLICEKLNHQGHQMDYIKEAYAKKKEKRLNNLTNLDNYDEFCTNLDREKTLIKNSLNEKSQDFTKKIQNIISSLQIIFSSFKDQTWQIEENLNLSVDNIKILYKKFFEDLNNIKEEDYMNLYLLNKLPEKYEKIILKEKIDEKYKTTILKLNSELEKFKEEITNIKEVSFECVNEIIEKNENSKI